MNDIHYDEKGNTPFFSSSSTLLSESFYGFVGKAKHLDKKNHTPFLWNKYAWSEREYASIVN